MTNTAGTLTKLYCCKYMYTCTTTVNAFFGIQLQAVTLIVRSIVPDFPACTGTYHHLFERIFLC